MSATDQCNAAATLRRRTIFPGKQGTAISFNLTAVGRTLLKDLAAEAGLSINDFAESLVRGRVGCPTPKLPAESRRTGPKGGAKSFFFGKERGRTTAVLLTEFGRRLLDEQVEDSGMSRGDYFEYVLREKAQHAGSGEVNETGAE